MSVEQSSQETTPCDAIGHTCSWNSFLEIECPLTSIVLTAKSRLLWSWKTLKKLNFCQATSEACYSEGAEDSHSVSKPIRFALALNVGDGVYWSHKSVKRKALFFRTVFLQLDVATIGDASCWPLEKMQLMGKTASLPKYVLSFEPLKWSWCGSLTEKKYR